jgi:type IV fimbrial biogenesis protein FimT
MSLRDPARQPMLRRQTFAAPAAIAGFTLFELMLTIAVAGILAAIAVPALRTFLQSDRLLTEQTQLVMSLDYARSEAIKEDSSVSVCASSNGTTCSGVANWSAGWLVVSSANPGQPLQVAPALAANNTLTEANGQAQVTFDATGLASTLVVPAQFKLCDVRGAAYARYSEVAAFSGRVASSHTLGQNLSGAGLACP